MHSPTVGLYDRVRRILPTGDRESFCSFSARSPASISAESSDAMLAVRAKSQHRINAKNKALTAMNEANRLAEEEVRACSRKLAMPR